MTDKNRSNSEQKRAQAEAETDRKRHRSQILSEMGVKPAEAALFSVLHYGITTSPSYVPSYAADPFYSPTGPLTEEECQSAMADCIAKEWLQILDEATLAKIVDELRDGRILGPVYGLPLVGCVDFTHSGADLWRQFESRCFSDSQPTFAYSDVIHCKTAHYFRTRAAALAEFPKENRDPGVTVTAPVPIGPWRVQWWRRFPEGYRVDVEERMHWQGRGGDGECFFMDHDRLKSDPQMLQRILDCHNVTLPEWLLLVVIDGDSYRPASYVVKRAAESGAREFGTNVSEDECRAGLEACLRYGWLRVVDPDAVVEVLTLFHEDPVFLPIPSQADIRLNEVDFTPNGAALYQMIQAEWLGPNWEDALCVSKEFYREEHLYCEAEEGLQSVYLPREEVVLDSKLVPIGPWCVYWWERFPTGFRLERKIGQALTNPAGLVESPG